MSDLDWNDLQAFLAVARAGRLTAAAKQQAVDHSTLSRRIAALETALGTRLFDRRSVGFVLTADGERLIADAEAMETLALRMRSRLDDASRRLSGTVRLGTPEAFGTYFVAPRLAQITTSHPELNIELVANPRSFSLSKREADLAVSMTRPADGRVYAKKLIDYALGIYAARNYLDAHAAIATRSDLERHPWIGYVEDLRWTQELDFLPHISSRLEPHVRISNIITQMTALRGGAGLGVLPHFMGRSEPDLVPVLADDVRLVRSYWLITHAETRDLARVRLMTDFMTVEAARLGDAFWLA